MLCHASPLNHLQSTGAVAALVHSLMENTDQPLLMADEPKISHLTAMLQQQKQRGRQACNRPACRTALQVRSGDWVTLKWP